MDVILIDSLRINKTNSFELRGLRLAKLETSHFDWIAVDKDKQGKE